MLLITLCAPPENSCIMSSVALKEQSNDPDNVNAPVLGFEPTLGT